MKKNHFRGDIHVQEKLFYELGYSKFSGERLNHFNIREAIGMILQDVSRTSCLRGSGTKELAITSYPINSQGNSKADWIAQEYVLILYL